MLIIPSGHTTSRSTKIPQPFDSRLGLVDINTGPITETKISYEPASLPDTLPPDCRDVRFHYRVTRTVYTVAHNINGVDYCDKTLSNKTYDIYIDLHQLRELVRDPFNFWASYIKPYIFNEFSKEAKK